jgi:hydroxymethylpyrimidine/phosphomethylpyrimidine kinase
MKYKCLSIAGFDGSGGAGIQADLKTFSALGCYAMTVLTALPVQNTCGVKSCYEIPLSCIQEQLESIFEDIRPDCIKIGMLFTKSIIELVSDFLKINPFDIPIVLDPVMMAKSGDSLLQVDAIEVLKQKLIPLSTIITPNLPEAYALVGKSKSFKEIGKKLLDLGASTVLLKGGHLTSKNSNDLYLDKNNITHWLKADRIYSNNTHGTGCTLSSAICAFLARKMTTLEACKAAKNYLTGAIAVSKNNSVGKGKGPVHHFYTIWPMIDKPTERL